MLEFEKHTEDVVPTESQSWLPEEECCVRIEANIAIEYDEQIDSEYLKKRLVRRGSSRQSVSLQIYERRPHYWDDSWPGRSKYVIFRNVNRKGYKKRHTTPNWPYSRVPMTFKSLSWNRNASISIVFAEKKKNWKKRWIKLEKKAKRSRTCLANDTLAMHKTV